MQSRLLKYVRLSSIVLLIIGSSVGFPCSANILKSDSDSLEIFLEQCFYYTDINRKIDSVYFFSQKLKNNINQIENEHKRLGAEFYIGTGHYRSDTAIFFQTLNELLDKSRNSSHHFLTVRTLHQLSLKYRSTRKEDLALNHLQEAEEILMNHYKEQDHYSNFLFATIKSTASSIYHRRGDLDQAVSLGLEALEFAQKSNDKSRLIKAYQNLSGAYGDLASPEKGLGTESDRKRFNQLTEKYLLLNYQAIEDQGVTRQRAVVTYNLAVYYALNSELIKSNEFLIEVFDLCTDLKFYELLFSAYDVISDNYIELNNLNSAELYLNKSKALMDRIYAPRRQIVLNHKEVLLMKERGQTRQLENRLKENLDFIKKEGSLKQLRTGYEQLYSFMNSEERWKEAHEYFLLFEATKDSIASIESINQINELTEKYESKLRENKILALKNDAAKKDLIIQRKNQALSIALLTAIILFGGFHFYNFRKNKIRDRNESILKQQLLRSQLNPHFLFNSLSAIQQLIYTDKNRKNAATHLAHFASLTRKILRNSDMELITLKEEIEFINEYVQLQQLRFDQPFQFEIYCSENIYPENINLPPMITQPFVENSIEHGILDKSGKGEISVNFEKAEEQLIIHIEDNGIGREESEFRNKNKDYRSKAISITKERIALLIDHAGDNSNLQIRDVKDPTGLICGTTVMIKLPLLKTTVKSYG